MEIEIIGYIILITVIALFLALFQYLYKSKKTKYSFFLVFLRFLTLFCILLLIINPKVSSKEYEIVKPKLLVAVDNSSSIKYAEKEQEVKNIINNIEQSNLTSKFDVNLFSIGTDLKRLDSLSFNEKSTNLSQPITELSELFSDFQSPIILITDGKQNIGKQLNFINSKKAVYPVIIGDTTNYSDLKISRLNVNKQSFFNNKFPVEVFLNYEGKAEISKWFTVYQNGAKVFQKLLKFSNRKHSEIISFYLKGEREGQQFYTAQIETLANEKNTINNTKNFSVNIIKEVSNIALVSEIVHPDIGMFKRAIESNKARKLKVLKPNELSDVSDYQLVILYQPVASFEKIFNQINEKKINYFIITGTATDWTFLNSIQNNFSKKAIHQTETYYPSFNPNYASYLTTELNFSDYPPLQDYFGETTFNVNYNALLFQTIQGIKTNKPLFATFQVGNQKAAVLFGENIWKWRMNSFQENKSFEQFDNFLANSIQYLASKKLNNRLNVTVNDFFFANDVIEFNASFLDENLNFDHRANLWLNYSKTGNNELKMVPFSLLENSFRAEIKGLEPGDYKFTVTVENQNENYSGKFKVLPFNIEQQNSNIDVKSFESLALNTGGNVSYGNDISGLITSLNQSQKYKLIQKEYLVSKSIIEWKWLLLIILLSLSVEWFTRKYFGKI